MDPHQVIQNHLVVCEEAYNLLSEENHLLKPDGAGISEEFIERKQGLLQRLEESLLALQQIDKNSFNKDDAAIDLIDRGQKKLMQIFLLDRENERLLSSRTNVSGHTSQNRPSLAPPPLLEPEPTPKTSHQAPQEAPKSKIHRTYEDNSSF